MSGAARLGVVGGGRLLDGDGALQMTGDAAVARSAGDEPMDEAADAAAEDFAEGPRFGVAAHERVPVVFRRLVVRRADAEVRFCRRFVDGVLHLRIAQVAN